MIEPTDRELMMFADGEIDDARRDEVAAFVATSEDARLKLKGLQVVGELARRDADRVATAFRADDISARVMARLEAEEGTAATRSSLRSKEVRAGKGDAARPANDNARYIFGLAALAAAAAAALWFWGKGAPPPFVAASDGPQAAVTAVAPEVAPLPPPIASSSVASAADASPANDTPGVEVASVNWGENKPGAVYYVPGNAGGATTTVVWLAAE
jgi:hypothetical protein